ncbi:MAG TPA: MBL fold metallo-hydrolase [Usitatibacter sp.]|nr:MBL fold metallo-hydrolase [Usitatibacter sp.]
MNRIALAALLVAALPALAQDFSKVEIKTTRLGDTTYMLVGAGGNLGLSVGEDAVFLIDDQFAPLTDKINAAIKAITPKPVRFVLNTHWHFDHTGGNENYGKAGTLIVAHENVRKRMDSDQVLEFFKQNIPRSPKAALPVVTFNGAMSFHINGDELRAIHVPHAHTDGDTIVHFLKSDVIHMGDVYFNGYYPFIDSSSGGSIDGVIAACDKILAIASDATKIIPGHGPLSNRAELRAYRDMLSQVSSRVKQLLAQGRTNEQVAAAGVTREYDEKWGQGFIKPDRFAAMVADGLRRKR